MSLTITYFYQTNLVKYITKVKFKNKIIDISIEKFDEPPKILYGHSDPIHFMRVSPTGKMIATADTLGKIKIVEFPNIYNMLTVLLYNNDDIKFCDFLNNNNLIVINSNYEIHLWNLGDFQLKSKFDLKTLLDINAQKRQENHDLNHEVENKKENENQDNIFCNEDQYIKNVYYVKGNKIILQINEDVKFLEEEHFSNRFITFSISDTDEISLKSNQALNKLKTDENTFLFLSEDTEKILFLGHKDKKDLNILSELKYSQLQ